MNIGDTLYFSANGKTLAGSDSSRPVPRGRDAWGYNPGDYCRWNCTNWDNRVVWFVAEKDGDDLVWVECARPSWAR